VTNDPETVLRETFRSREHLAVGGQEGLLEAARDLARRRRRRARVVGSALATAVVVGGVSLALAVPRHVAPWQSGAPSQSGAPPPTGAVPPTGAASVPAVEPQELPRGWRWESSLGLQIAVPGAWATNDYGCHMTDRPSVVRGQGAVRDCFTPEPAAKRVAIIGEAPDGPDGDGLPEQITIHGFSATRTLWRLPDGRYAGRIAVQQRDVYLDVRTSDEAELRAILASARVVETDHVGCRTGRDPVTPRAVPASALAPTEPAVVGVCYYGSTWAMRLEASAELRGAAARDLARAVNDAPPGRNPDAPASQCRDVDPAVPDVVLQFGDAAGRVSRVWVSFSSCTGRGLDNGARQARLSEALLAEIMAPLSVGYAFPAPL